MARPGNDKNNPLLAAIRQVQGQVGALVTKLDRLPFASESTGRFLENMSQLLQSLAVVVGAVWILIDYMEFKKQNNKLVNQQLELANQTAQLTQSSLDLNNQLNNLKLVHSTQGRLSMTTDSSVVRSSKFDDGTFLYRFQVSMTAKNISDSNVTIQAVVTEVFSGSLLTDKLQVGKANLMNLPNSSFETETPGEIKWTNLGGYSQRDSQAADEVKKVTTIFPETSGGMPGEIDPGESHDWTAEFVLRAHPADLVASAITFWTTDESKETRRFSFTRAALLSEAADSQSTNAGPPPSPAIHNN